MKKNILIIISFSIFSLTSYSQIIFEKGYFINESNQKIDCLIRNADWTNNPSKFDYKLTENGEIQKGDIQSVKEFSITGACKYIRTLVKIDKSSGNINNLSAVRNPVFEEEQLFLKILVEGNYPLYIYNQVNLNLFFYKIADSEIKQLVYKQYLLNDNVATNDYYKQQLLNDFRDQGIELNNVKKLKYYQTDFEDFFIKLNKITNSNYTISESKQKKTLFNLSLRPGVNSSSLSIENSNAATYYSTDFGNKLTFRFGIESEFIFSFNKNKWAVIIEPTFQYFKGETNREVHNFSGGVTTIADYQSIELPIGIRHYLFLNNNSKIFVNISYHALFDYDGTSSIKQIKNSDGNINYDLSIKARPNISFGMGYKYKDKYSVEMRYISNRNLLGNYQIWNSDYKVISLIFGYKLF